MCEYRNMGVFSRIDERNRLSTLTPTLPYPHTLTLILCCVLLLALCRGSIALPPGDIRALTDWSDLPLLGGPTLFAVSNWSGKNAGRFVDETPGRSVLLDENGPGCLARMSIHAEQGTLKIYLDDAATPQVDIPLSKLYQDFAYYRASQTVEKADAQAPQQFPFLMPLSSSGIGYQNECYLPIPFASHAKVVLEHAPDANWGYYDLLWRRYPAGTAVTTYNPQGMAARDNEVRAAATAWRAMGQPPCSYPDAQCRKGMLAISPHTTRELWRADGGGTIVGIRLRAHPWHRAVDRLLMLRAYWDGEQRPAVETPIGDLCVSHQGFRQSGSLPAGGGDKDDWYWCYLPMPFTAGARLTLENMSAYPISALDYEITVRPGPPAAQAGRFCARWKRETLPADGRYVLLEAAGAGKLVGFSLFADGFPVPLKNYRQHDRLALYQDGEETPRLANGALLVYFNGGWYTGPGWINPLMANTELDINTFGTYAGYRFFLTDAPNWAQSVRLQLEVKPDAEAGKDFTSVACWYRAPGATDTFMAPTKDQLRLPVRHYPFAISAATLLRTAEFTRGDLMIVDDADDRYAVGDKRYISFAPIGFGDSLTLRVPVENSGEYDLSLRLLYGPSGGSWKVYLNDRAESGKPYAFSSMAPETGVPWIYGASVPLGRVKLPAGENTLTFTAASPPLGSPQRGLLLNLDSILVAPVKSAGNK